MTMQIMICLAILAVAVVLFSWDQVPADVVALGVLLASWLIARAERQRALALAAAARGG